MINKKQLKQLVEITLEYADYYSQSACDLILGTIAQESRCGTYIIQLGGGPALGICQMETNTEKDIWNNYIKYKPELKMMLFEKFHVKGYSYFRLLSDLGYQIIMCRIHYLRKKESLPAFIGNAELYINELGIYWKKYYNTSKGKGKVDEFVNNYKKYIL